MLKKIILAITLILFLSLMGCQKITPITLETSDLDSYIEIDSDQLVLMLNNEFDFMLYISSVTCTSCAEFSPILESVIKNYNVKVYKIEAGEYFKSNNPYLPYEFTPTVVIIDNGEVFVQIDAVKDIKTFESYDHFIKFYQKYIQ